MTVTTQAPIDAQWDAGTIKNPVTKTHPRPLLPASRTYWQQAHPKKAHHTRKTTTQKMATTPEEERKTNTTHKAQAKPTHHHWCPLDHPMHPPFETHPHLEASTHTTDRVPQANQNQQQHPDSAHQQTSP